MALAVALVGCGGGGRSTGRSAHGRPECEGSKSAPQREHARTRLKLDLRRVRLAAATVPGHTERGNDALNAALDRFLLSVALPTLPVHERSRFIDRAAAVVAPKCYLCFQALESSRPIAAGAKLPCD